MLQEAGHAAVYPSCQVSKSVGVVATSEQKELRR